VPPQVAHLLDLPFSAGVRRFALGDDDVATITCEHDDEIEERRVALPALLSCAERLCEPSKVEPDGCRAVPASRIRRVTAADLGEGPWGEAGSPTRVGATRSIAIHREPHLLPEAPLLEQVQEAIRILGQRGALTAAPHVSGAPLPATGG